MAGRSKDPEADAINEAFREKVRDLFGKLVTNLMVGQTSEAKSAEQFAAGLGFARRAKELALDAAKTAPTAAAKGKGTGS